MRPSIYTKAILNPGEAIRLFSLSGRKFRRLILEKNLPFVALYKTRKLIIRDELEKYLESNPEEKERLKNGEPRYKKKGL